MSSDNKEKNKLNRAAVSGNWINFKKSYSQVPVFKIKTSKPPIKQKKITQKESKVVSVDCEMVGDKNGVPMLARVSIVDFQLNCLYDKFVKPTSEVGDYRTRFSGIRPENIENGEDISVVRQEVRKIIYNKLLVGHGLWHDLKVLDLNHPSKLIRDTSLYQPFRKISNGKTPGLRKLTEHFLGDKIQQGEHSSVQDAEAAMKLYKKFRQKWESTLTNIKKKT